MMMDAPVAVVCGHYGVGKTNLTLNIALDAAAGGRAVTVIDLDVVNPFFRSSDYRALLDERGIRLVAPVFAGTNVDGPSLSGTIEPAIDGAQRAWRDGDERPFVAIDAGGDDAGATALGRFARTVEQAPYEMLYVVNRNRNLTQEPAEAVEDVYKRQRSRRRSGTSRRTPRSPRACSTCWPRIRRPPRRGS